MRFPPFRPFEVGELVDFEYLNDNSSPGVVEHVEDPGDEFGQRLRVRWPDNSVSKGLASGYKRVAPTRRPALVISKDKLRESSNELPMYNFSEPSELPHNVPGVDKVKDILNGLVGFSSEGDVDQALTSLRDVIDGIAALRPDLRILFSGGFLVGARRGFAVSVEKVNAHIG